MEKKRNYINNSVKKALKILDLFNENKESLSGKEIADHLGTSPGTLFPILSTLQAHGYLEKDDETKKYNLGLAFLAKGALVLRNLDIRDRAQPHLKELFERCNENIHLAIFENGKVLYIDRKEAAPTLMVRSFVGKQVPAHCTALGKVLLAYLDDWELEHFLSNEKLEPLTKNTITHPDDLKAELSKIRNEGFAIDDEEYQMGGVCFAAAIFGYDKRSVAAVSVSIPKRRHTAEVVTRTTNEIKRIALNISKRLGYSDQANTTNK